MAVRFFMAGGRERNQDNPILPITEVPRFFEAPFKYSVTLLDNIEFIVARSDNERREIIQSFTRRGIKKLPDGRKVEDIVHTPQSWSKRKQ